MIRVYSVLSVKYHSSSNFSSVIYCMERIENLFAIVRIVTKLSNRSLILLVSSTCHRLGFFLIGSTFMMHIVYHAFTKKTSIIKWIKIWDIKNTLHFCEARFTKINDCDYGMLNRVSYSSTSMVDLTTILISYIFDIRNSYSTPFLHSF